ncbi:uncharacterized protein LOC120715933 [Scomber scombrus]|uniref:Uncharacterized protein LOC120715933 n=1 Tax=Scomber scombrus TaxID=13677 RepID=A0AAV1QM98_SCOSC
MDNKPLHCLSGSRRQQQAWAMAFKICSTQAQFVAPDGSIGHVRTINRRPVRVPAQSEVLLWGRTKAEPGGKDYQCLVEPEEVGGLFVARSLSTVQRGRVLIKIKNPNDSPMYLYRHQKLAKTCEVDPADITPAHSVSMVRVSTNAVKDRLLGLSENVGCSSAEDWVKCHQRRLQLAFERAVQHRDSEMARQKTYYDQKADGSPLTTGQQPVIRRGRLRGAPGRPTRSASCPVPDPDPVLGPVPDHEPPASSEDEGAHSDRSEEF